MRRLTRFVPTSLFCCAAALAGGVPVHAQPAETTIAAVPTGSLRGMVLDETGEPLDGAVVSALGGRTLVAVTDRVGEYRFRDLPPGPYLLRVHRTGYAAARGTIVDIRQAGSTASFMLRRLDDGSEPRVALAGAAVGVQDEEVSPASGRDDTEKAWRLRRLPRSVLKEAVASAAARESREAPVFAEPLLFLRDAVGVSARHAASYLASGALQGQLYWLTTGTFHTPAELLDREATRGSALLSVGAPIGEHGDWQVRAALNQGDLGSWLVAGTYATRQPASHRFSAGMSYGVQRYQGGNALALAALADGVRVVGSIYGADEWTLSPKFTLDYGLHYAHYDYLVIPSLVSPHVRATVALAPDLRMRATMAHRASAPGADEFLPPERAAFVPPRRTFSSLDVASPLRTQSTDRYALELEHDAGARTTVSARFFRDRVDDQIATLFGIGGSGPAGESVGHYLVAAAGDLRLSGVGVTVSRMFAESLRVRGDYALMRTHWFGDPASSVWRGGTLPLGRAAREQVHDATLGVDAQVTSTATKVSGSYRVSNGFAGAAGVAPALATRFDVTVSQGLPLRHFLRAEWEAVLSVRNGFRGQSERAGVYDELLVVNPPKQMVGGLTVRF